MAVTLNINNQQRTLDFGAYMPLLWAIRDVVGLTGTKFGCGPAVANAIAAAGGRRIRVLPMSKSLGA